MVRVNNGIARHKRHKKFIKEAKGFSLGRKNVYKQVRLALVKKGQHAYESRKLKKRDYRRLWIERLSAAIRVKGSKYSVFVNTLTNKNIGINRKMLSNINIVFPKVFDVMYEQITTSSFERTFVEQMYTTNTKELVAEKKAEVIAEEKKKPVKKTTKKKEVK
ncbi:MAG: 50S ribosomal protein L20 [Candidatus Absconditabacteria bacterium]